MYGLLLRNVARKTAARVRKRDGKASRGAKQKPWIEIDRLHTFIGTSHAVTCVCTWNCGQISLVECILTVIWDLTTYWLSS
jgi:hypothetical protein